MFEIPHRTRCRIRSRILIYDIIYYIVFTYDIAGQDTVLANRTYDIVGHIVYDIVGQTSDIVYDLVFSYDIVGGRTVLANRRLRRRIRTRRKRTTSYVYVRILRYPRTMSDAMSKCYDVEIFKRYDRTTS
jgi:hypothetical protein